MEGKLWIVNCDESAVRELLILAEDMLLYVPEYFRGKHRMDGELADLRARLGLGVFRPLRQAQSPGSGSAGELAEPLRVVNP